MLPFHVVSLEGGVGEGSAENPGIVFSEDGKELFLCLYSSVVNVWSLFVYFWPEVLGAAVIVAAFIVASKGWRIVCREQMVGKPHCRKCNYCLEGCPSDRCPECGYTHARQRAIAGLPSWRRALPAVTVLTLIVAGYAALWVARVPRRGYASTWFNWASADLFRYASQRNEMRILMHSVDVTRLARIDVATGRVARTLRSKPSGMELSSNCSLSPNGKTLLLTNGSEVVLIDADSGRTLRQLSPPDRSNSGRRRVGRVAGFSTNGEFAYFVWLDLERSKTQLVAWELTNGRAEVVFETSTSTWSLPGCRDLILCRDLYRLLGAGARLVERGHPHVRPNEYAPVETVVHDLDRRGPVVTTIRTSCSSADPAFSADGRRMFILSPSPWEGVVEWDLFSGERRGDFGSLGGRFHCMADVSPCFDRNRERLFVAADTFEPSKRFGSYEAIIVAGDAEKREWVAQFAVPPMLTPKSLAISGDGRVLAVVCRRRDASGPAIVDQLLLYDLSHFGEARPAQR